MFNLKGHQQNKQTYEVELLEGHPYMSNSTIEEAVVWFLRELCKCNDIHIPSTLG